MRVKELIDTLMRLEEDGYGELSVCYWVKDEDEYYEVEDDGSILVTEFPYDSAYPKEKIVSLNG